MQVSVMIIYYSRGHGLTTQVLWQHDPPGHSKCSVHLFERPTAFDFLLLLSVELFKIFHVI